MRLDVAYDGTDFFGWARQPERRTVEGVLGAGLETILRTRPVSLTVAGRTDAGVHARGQVVHVDLPVAAWRALPGRSDRSPAAAASTRLSGVLPDDVVVRDVRVAPPGFDARFSALSRHYEYRICDAVATRDPLRRRETVLLRDELDVAAMAEAAGGLLGLHDFAAFCRRRAGATTVRTLLAADPSRDAEGTVVIRVAADAFCHSMVRALVGALVAVGSGRQAVDWPAAVRAARQRDPRVRVMPPGGLTLASVTYPPDDQLAERAYVARRRRDSDAVREVWSDGP